MRRAGNRDGVAAGHPWHLYPLGAVAVAIVILAISQLGTETSAARTSRQTVTAENGVVQSTVSGSGNVEAGTDLSVNFQTGGTLQHVYVTQGQHVYAGQLLAILDPTAADLTLDQAHRSLTAAEDQLSAAQLTAASASTSSSAATTSGASLQTTRAAAQFVSDTQIVTTTTTVTATPPAPSTRARTTTTTAAPAPPTRTTPAGTQTTTTAASRQGSSANAGSGSASAAGSSGATTNSAGSAQSAAGSVASAQANVDTAEANLRTAELAVNNTKLYAPVSGTLVSLSSAVPGDTISSGSTTSGANSGASSSAGSGSGTSASSGSLGGSGSSSTGSSSNGASSSSSSFAEIVDTASMSMTVALSESDISKVHTGQAATVTLDALSGVELAARVSHIATVGTTSSSVVSYDVTLTLVQHDGRVKPGMSASASVITGSAQGVTVPNAAVTGTGTLGRVQLLRGSTTVSRPVVIGVRGDSRTQIISGLRAGQQLQVTTTLPSLGTSGATSSGSSGTLSGTGSRRFGGFGAGGFGGAGGAAAGGGAPPAGP